MDRKAYSDALYDQFARIGKATSSPQRLRLLEVLCQGPRTVETLARETGQSVANTSQHLQILKSARLVEGHRDGLHVVYRAVGQDVCAFLDTLRSLASARLAEVEHVRREYRESRDTMEPVDGALLIDRVRDGEVTVLDVRPREEFEAGHIRGAMSIPHRELKQRLDTLERGQDVVAYCRGPYCVLALEAVETLRANGFRAFYIEDGVAELRDRGFTVEVGGAEAPTEDRE